MANLTTKYLGLPLSNPLVHSASPLTRNPDNIKRMEDAGIGAIVLHSLFEEQILQADGDTDQYLAQGDENDMRALSYFPPPQEHKNSPEIYMELIRKAKEAVRTPIIASLNGVSTGYWVRYAREIEQAGADALELNVYYIPTVPWLSGDNLEQMHIDLLRDVKANVRIPVAVKLNPYFTNLTNLVYYLDQAGADGFVLFNRFYQADIDLQALQFTQATYLTTSLDSHSLLLPVHWIAILSGWVQTNFAACTGIHTINDVLKCILSGATVTMMASEIMAHGVERVAVMRRELEDWLDAHEYGFVSDIRGKLSMSNVPSPAAFERAQYMRNLTEFDPKLKWRSEIQ